MSLRLRVSAVSKEVRLAGGLCLSAHGRLSDRVAGSGWLTPEKHPCHPGIRKGQQMNCCPGVARRDAWPCGNAVSDRFAAAFPGSNANAIFHGEDEYFAIADLAD